MAKTLRWPASFHREERDYRVEQFKFWGLIGLVAFVLTYITYVFRIGFIFVVASWGGIYFIFKAFKSLVDDLPYGVWKYQKGVYGEKLVAHALNTLPDEWRIINDFYARRSQIDHVAVGPNGVFCIETKNWGTSGTDIYDNWYKFDGEQWYVSDSNPIIQNRTHIRSIKSLLKSELGKNIWVYSVIVMVYNRDGIYDFHRRETQDRMILFTHELQNIVNVQGYSLTPEEIEIISEVLLREAEENDRLSAENINRKEESKELEHFP